MRYFIAAIGFMLAAGQVTATERAYVLVEAAPNATLTESLGHNLQNCLALQADLQPHETIAHLECTGLADINIAVAEMAKKAGVVRATLWVLRKGE
jgi:hypothetical protein